MVTEDYVSFEIAKLLKEKGFDCNTNCYYVEDSVTRTLFYSPIRENHNASIENNEFDIHINISNGKMSAPTLQMVMKWLREEKNFFIEIQCYGCEANEKAHFEYSYVIEEFVKYEDECLTLGLEHIKGKSRFNSYEEACEAAIKYCLEKLV